MSNNPRMSVNTNVRSPQNRSPTKRAQGGPPSTTSSPRSRSAGLTLHAASTCFVSADARLEGAINLGDGCVLHPRCAVLVSPGCTLSFGPGCVVEENAIVRFVNPSSGTSAHAYVGENNVFMVGSFVDIVAAEPPTRSDRGESIGSWNTFSPRSRVEGVRVGDQCTFGAGTVMNPAHHIFVEVANRPRPKDLDGDTLMAASSKLKVPNRTVVYGAASAARKWDGSGEAMEKNVRASATEFLRDVLPKSNKQRALN